MAINSCTFIIVPDATSQCKRYNIPKFMLYLAGASGIVFLIILGIVSYTFLGEYRTMSLKFAELQKLKKVSINQKNTIDHYEQDITQLSINLSQIKQLNARLMMLTGLDPAKGENNLGLGGSEDVESNPDAKKK